MPRLQNRFSLQCILLGALAWTAATSSAHAAELLVGGATVSITPDKPVALWGQMVTRVSQGVESPVTATVLALETREAGKSIEQTVMVACDLVAIPNDVLAKTRAKVKDRLPDFPLDKIVLSATHTHTAPILVEGIYEIPPKGVVQPNEYVDFFADVVAKAIVQAWDSRKPGKVSWGLGHADIAHNRRAVYSDNTAVMYGSTAKPEFRMIEGYEDHGVEVLFFWDANDKLVATAVNVACPAQEVEGRMSVNADFWHQVREALRKEYGQQLHVLAWTGAGGDQSPHLMFRQKAEERMQKLRGLDRLNDISRQIVSAWKEAYDGAKKDMHTDVPLVHRVEKIELPRREVTERDMLSAKGKVEEYSREKGKSTLIWWHGGVVKRFEKQKAGTVEPYFMELHAIRLGDIAIATNDFELFTDYGIQMKTRSPALQTFVIQLAGPGSYLPSERAFRGGGYSAIPESNEVSPAGGQVLVEQTVKQLNSLWAASPKAAEKSPESAAKLAEEKYKVRHETKLPVPLRDGLKLGAEVYRPDAEGKFPALMVLRYFRGQHQNAWGDYYAKRGYVVALIDSRGRGDSEGKWVTAVNEPKDGYDAQEWLGTQPWCDGKIGTMDISYNGFTQLMPAPFANKHVRCLIPLECQQTNFGHIYNDGVMQLNVVFQYGLHTQGKLATATIYPADHEFYRQLPLIGTVDKHPNVAHVKDWYTHAKYDDYWKYYGIKEKYGKIQVPALFVSGWYDNLVHETFRNFKGFREQGGSLECRNGTKLMIGPWIHGGSLGYSKLNEVQLRWFDYWLKDVKNGVDKDAPIKIYVMGPNVWRDENEWPLKRTKYVDFLLTSDGKANSVSGDGTLSKSAPSGAGATDKFTYDPNDPVPTLGGQISTLLPGPSDRSSVQKRKDVLVYTTEPLAEDTEVTGPVELKLFAASSAVDTDFTATLTAVHPDGKAIHICEGIRGVSFRESLENPTPIVPGKIYEYSISLWETSNVFKAGQRIRLEVSSSNFPRYARNQNTGLPFGTSDKIVKAEQTIYHDANHPSRLILPVIPAGSK